MAKQQQEGYKNNLRRYKCATTMKPLGFNLYYKPNNKTMYAEADYLVIFYF